MTKAKYVPEYLRQKQEAASIRKAATELLHEVDGLDGLAELPYRLSVQLAVAADALRVALGQKSKLDD